MNSITLAGTKNLSVSYMSSKIFLALYLVKRKNRNLVAHATNSKCYKILRALKIVNQI